MGAHEGGPQHMVGQCLGWWQHLKEPTAPYRGHLRVLHRAQWGAPEDGLHGLVLGLLAALKGAHSYLWEAPEGTHSTWQGRELEDIPGLVAAPEVNHRA